MAASWRSELISKTGEYISLMKAALKLVKSVTVLQLCLTVYETIFPLKTISALLMKSRMLHADAQTPFLGLVIKAHVYKLDFRQIR